MLRRKDPSWVLEALLIQTVIEQNLTLESYKVMHIVC